MDYTITHTTHYSYTSPVSVCQNIVTLTPREDGRVRCLVNRLRVKPTPVNTHRRNDFFGNIHTIFSIDENHDDLTISAVSRVTVQSQECSETQRFEATKGVGNQASQTDWQTVSRYLSQQILPDWYKTSSFLYDSPRIRRSQHFAAYARPCFPKDTTILAAALDLAARIHADFSYDSKATETHTPTEQAFVMRKGVCQDFAHIMIACLRSMGIPARYVSGYLRTIPPPGKPRLVGADQSHAWVSVYCGPINGWIEMDPTNNCLCGTDHIPIAWGRDYSDVVPVRGAYLGGGEGTIMVSVDVVPVEADTMGT